MESSGIEMQSMLAKMNMLRRQFENAESISNNQISLQNESTKIGFSATLANALNEVNSMQKESARLKTAFEKGDPDISLVDVTLASQKASVGFEAMLSVRNKFVEAYKEVMNMPV